MRRGRGSFIINKRYAISPIMAHRLLTQRGGGSMFRILSRPFSNKTIDFETETSEISKLRSFLNNNVKTKGLGETQMNIVMAMETPPQTTTPVHFAMLMDGHNIEIDGDTPAYFYHLYIMIVLKLRMVILIFVQNEFVENKRVHVLFLNIIEHLK
eukprot:294034_1